MGLCEKKVPLKVTVIVEHRSGYCGKCGRALKKRDLWGFLRGKGIWKRVEFCPKCGEPGKLIVRHVNKQEVQLSLDEIKELLRKKIREG